MYETSINHEIFPEEDNILVVERKNVEEDMNEDFKYPKKYSYEFISFHPVAVTSEMLGTSIEELVMHNFPNKRSWECTRLCKFPQEIVLRFNYRSLLKYVLLRAKHNRPINGAIIYIADGVGGNFNDLQYRKLGSVDYIGEECINIKVDGFGNYIKIVLLNPSIKTQDNPFGQVSLSQCKFFGRKINHLQFYAAEEEVNKDSIDNILINLGIPLDNDYFFITNENYEIAPVDSETKITLKDLLTILKKAESVKDYEILKKIKNDIKIVYYLGNEILNRERDLKIYEAKEKYDKAIELRKIIEDLKRKRDGYDAIYETTRYERMIIFRRPTTAELLDAEERRIREEKDLLERLRREKLEKELREKEEEERRRRLEDESKRKLFIKTDEKKKFTEYVPQTKPTKEITDQLKYNQGDKDLEPYFGPLVLSVKGKVPEIDLNLLRRAERQKVLQVTGVRLYSSLMGDDWKMREAAIKAFLEFIQNPLLSKYHNNTLPIFNASIEIAKKASEDKVIQIYLEGLSILATCLAPPVCGNDLDPSLIQKSVNYFIPIIIKKISELNFRARDVSLATLIQIFKHPALHVGDLVKGCMDIIEHQEIGVSPDKQPWNILLARLEIILHILDEYGIDEQLWDWYPVFTELILPSLFHSNPDCRLNAIENIVLLYKFLGDDIKIIINDLQNLKPNLKDNINSRMDEIDIILKKDINSQANLRGGARINKNTKSLNTADKRLKSQKDNSIDESKGKEQMNKSIKILNYMDKKDSIKNSDSKANSDKSNPESNNIKKNKADTLGVSNTIKDSKLKNNTKSKKDNLKRSNSKDKK